jgi:hypothetical protein
MLVLRPVFVNYTGHQTDCFLVLPMNVARFAVFEAALILCLAVSPLLGQSSPSDAALPVVKSAELPLYPYVARLARLQGTAEMKVWTDGASVVRVEGSGAHKLLIEAAETNLKTWRFYPHKPLAFTVIFTFKLELPEVYGAVNPTLRLDLPTSVEITTKLPTVETTAGKE